MNNLIPDILRALENPALLFPAELFLKGLLILALCGGTAWLLRRASAASRHLVWIAGLGSLLVLPFTVGYLPSVPVPVIASAAVPASPSAVETPEYRPGSGDSAPLAHEANEVPAAAGRAAGPPSERIRSAVPRAVLVIWMGGGLLVILPLVWAILQLGRLFARAPELDSAEWRALLHDCCDRLGIKRTVRLLEGPAGVMPMTWGIRRPAILVPGEAPSWSVPRRRSVLLHELAHIKRNDCLSQLLTRAACAIHWFNPLAWLAYRQALATREQACDDLVLLADEMKPSTYAKHLLSIARESRTGAFLDQGAVPMARKNALEGRVLAVLGESTPRRGPSRNTFFAAVLGSVGLALAAGTVSLTTAANPEQSFGRTHHLPVADVLSNPPTIKRLVAEQVQNHRGEFLYWLLVHDSGDFMVKNAKTLEDLESTTAVPGAQYYGRIGDFVWTMYHKGELIATDLQDPAIENATDESLHSEAISAGDMGSGFGRSFLTFGILNDYLSDRTLSDESFSFVGPRWKAEGTIDFDTSESGDIQFNVRYGKAHRDKEFPEHDLAVEGIIGEDGIPRKYEVWHVDSDGRKGPLLSTVRVLELEVVDGDLPDEALRPETYLEGGYYVMSNLSKETIGDTD